MSSMNLFLRLPVSGRIFTSKGLVHNYRFSSTAWPYVKDTYINDFKIIDQSKNHEYSKSIHAFHCMVYAKMNEQNFTNQRPRGCALMQMRFDGYLGFPGGLVDQGEDVIHGLNRELEEEMNLDLSKHKVTEKDFVFSQHSSSRELTLHFYALETTLPELEKIEAGVHQAKDYGSEVLGLVRVPLYTMRDGFRGFPAFLTHAFIGSAREQLLHTLQHLKIMTPQEISNALSAKPNKS